MTLPIDVGAGAADYDTISAATYTIIDLTNPANLGGLITSVDVWANTNITGLRVGIFYLVSGTTYQCRASQAIGNVTAGSKQTFPVSLPIQKGDFIGFYYATGAMERNGTGGSGMLFVLGEYIDPGDQVSYTYSSQWKQAIYGQGVVRGWSSK